MNELDWREMFAKYIDIIGVNEGVHFLERHDWTAEEWEGILDVYRERLVPQGWTPL